MVTNMNSAQQFQTKLLSMQENMMSFALSLTANKEDALDLLQDTTLKVLDNQEKFIDNANFKGWVFTIMRNIFINNYNKIVRTQTIMDMGTDLSNVTSIHYSGVASAESNVDLKEINKTIAMLDDDMRAPFALHVSGYKYEEIAEKLNVPMGTVKSRIFSARYELQQKLKDYYYN